MTLHERIFELRRAAGLSQETLPERVGVSRQAIGKWENGAALPGLDNLQALAATLGVSCDELLTGDDARGAFGSGAARRDAGAVPAGSGACPKEGGPNAPPAAGAEATEGGNPPGAGAGLSNAGLHALLDAYQAAQRQAARRQRMLLASLAVMLLALACLGVLADTRLRALAGRVDDVSGRMDGIDRRIDDRVGSIRAQIEESLQESERIVANFDWQYLMLSQDSMELTLTATPKSCREGTAAAFSVVPSNGDAITAEAAPRADGVFTARLSIPLTEAYENFSVMAAFTTEGETQSQLLFYETAFYSARRTLANLTLREFRATVLSPGSDAARLSLGGECGLEIRRAGMEDAPVPVSAEVALLVDGERAAVKTVELNDTFGAQDALSGDEAQLQAGSATALSATFYVRFEPMEIPLPRTGAVLEATVTDSAGRTVTCRQEVYAP